MLKKRVITAVVLLAILLPALFHSSIAPFAGFTLLLIVAAGWEWARLNGCGPTVARLLGLGLGAVLLVLWLVGGLAHDWRPLWLAVGGLWLARDTPFSEAEQSLLRQLADTYAHAWLALQPHKPWRMRWPRKKLLAVAAALSLLLLIPVRQSVLAPAEVVPLGGQVVAAPLDGVIAEFLVKPNQTVKTGDVLVRFESTTLKAQADVAERALGVADAELKSNSQRSFADAESSAKVDLLAARVEQKRAERDYARELLKRSEVRAERDGIAVFADAERLTGKPVQTGERLMDIADQF